MLSIVAMDENVTLREQMAQDIGPVFLINKFTVKLEEVDQLLGHGRRTLPRRCFTLSLDSCQHTTERNHSYEQNSTHDRQHGQ